MFADRTDAGRRLAEALASRTTDRPVVVALPRGGVIVADPIARRLSAPLDVIVVRKLGCPWQPELGVGAIAEGGVQVLNDRLITELGLSDQELAEVTARERTELARRARRYRGQRTPVDLTGRPVFLVDDGIATGFTMRAAIEAVRERGADRVLVAVPVATEGTIGALEAVADEVVVLETPESFFAIGDLYDDFRPVPDEEVVSVLTRSWGVTRSPGLPEGPSRLDRPVGEPRPAEV